MSIEIWMEGYVIQGGEGKASLVATIEADSFDEAVEKYNGTAKQPANRREPLGFGEHSPADLRDGVWTIWGCRLFDNEADARKNFG